MNRSRFFAIFSFVTLVAFCAVILAFVPRFDLARRTADRDCPCGVRHLGSALSATPGRNRLDRLQSFNRRPFATAIRCKKPVLPSTYGLLAWKLITHGPPCESERHRRYANFRLCWLP